MRALHDLPNQAQASRGARSPQNLSRRPACKTQMGRIAGMLKEAPDEIAHYRKSFAASRGDRLRLWKPPIACSDA